MDCFFYRFSMQASQLEAYGVKVLDDGSLWAPRPSRPMMTRVPSIVETVLRKSVSSLGWISALLERVISEVMQSSNALAAPRSVPAWNNV